MITTLLAAFLAAAPPPAEPRICIFVPGKGTICGTASCTVGAWQITCTVAVGGHGCGATCGLSGCGVFCKGVPHEDEDDLPAVDYDASDCSEDKTACAACEAQGRALVCGIDIENGPVCGVRCDATGCRSGCIGG